MLVMPAVVNLCGWMFFCGPVLVAASAQPPSPLGLDLGRLKRVLTTPGAGDAIAVGTVRLDGRRIFTITAPAVKPENRGMETSSPISERIQSIEKRLQQQVQRGLDPKMLTVTSRIDSDTGLPVLYVNGQYLMTVTSQDALLHTGDLNQWTAELTQLIRDVLLRAHRERQPEFIQQQAWVAGGILLSMIGISIAITYQRRRLMQPSSPPPVVESPWSKVDETALPSPSVEGAQSAGAAQPIQATLEQRRQGRFHKGIQLLLLQVSQYGLWVGGSYSLLGLLPQTRWLQFAIFSSLRIPLQVAGVGFLAYVLIRISFVAIDRSCSALRDQVLLSSERSGRGALRTLTIARVMRGISVVSFTSIGVLLTLSILGVDLVPLLAGVSVIGLAISFASQSLIKDAINGFFILLEDQYGVGDVISVGGVSGFVEHMNLRITQLRDTEGRLITLPNSMIDIVQNLTKDWSRADLFIDVAYSADPEQALDLVRQVALDLYQDRVWKSEILEAPEVLGIEKLDYTGMQIRVWIKTVPLAQWNVSREFRRRLKLKLDQAQLAIGVPQQIITAQEGPVFPRPPSPSSSDQS